MGDDMAGMGFGDYYGKEEDYMVRRPPIFVKPVVIEEEEKETNTVADMLNDIEKVEKVEKEIDGDDHNNQIDMLLRDINR